MDDAEETRRALKSLRAEVHELREERRYNALARIYAALVPIFLIAPWFPVYIDSTYRDGDTEFTVEFTPLLWADGPLAPLLYLLVASLIAIPLGFTFRPRVETPIAPGVLIAIGALGMTLLLTRAGVPEPHFPEFAPAGIAIMVGILSLAATATAHIVFTMEDRSRQPTPPV